MEMESMVANTPCHSALLTSGRRLVGLAFNAKVHDVVSANGAVVDDNVPSPKSNGIPLLHLKLLLALDSLTAGAFDLLGDGARRIAHLDIGHDECKSLRSVWVYGGCVGRDAAAQLVRAELLIDR